VISAARRRQPIGAVLLVAACLMPAPTGAAGRPVTLASLDGTSLSGQLYEAAARPSPGVVLVHMLSRSKADWDALAQELERRGITALAIDLRGHGASGGTAGSLSEMVQDVRAAVQWLAARPTVRPDAVGMVGASLGANLALLAAVEQPVVRVVAAVSPSLDYRGLRVSPDVMRKLGDRGIWLAASTEDPFALRTLKELTENTPVPRDQQLSTVAAHGTALLAQDPSLARALVDWLHQRLLS
jgi:alpha-beta hydrolase superfamily lysophospholipase